MEQTNKSIKNLGIAIGTLMLSLLFTYLTKFAKIIVFKGVIPDLIIIGLAIFFIRSGIVGFSAAVKAVRSKEVGIVKYIGLVGNGLIISTLFILIASFISDILKMTKG